MLSKWNFFRFGQILFNLAGTFAAHNEKEALFLRFFKGLYWSPMWKSWVWKKELLFLKKVSKILHPKIWTNPATRVLTFCHGDLAGTPQPLGNNSRSKFMMGICKVRLHFSGESRGGARGVSTKPRSEGPKKFFGRPPPAPLSNGLDDRKFG